MSNVGSDRINSDVLKRGGLVGILTVFPSCGNYPTLVKQRAAGADASLLFVNNKRGRGKESKSAAKFITL